jgi:alkanesulfonate monooxygenase SsuD/methylene tetrahydromethanopterin reductase-like flavin-dependent oxidoreductase (luciferase family)
MAVPFRAMLFTTYPSPRNWDLPDNEISRWDDATCASELARVLEERGMFDGIVLADVSALATEYGGNSDAYVRNAVDSTAVGDPVPINSAIAAATNRLGLLLTLSTSLYPPQLLAQTVGTIDHLTRGRTGWNMVTSFGPDVAKNYGLEDLPPSSIRYERAEEVLQHVQKLWTEARVSRPGEADPDALDMPALPQGTPVIMQAGGSDAGRDFAARHADIVIMHRNSVTEMKTFRDDIRRRADSFGRDPDSCKVFFTVKAVIGDTEESAAALVEKERRRPSVNVEAGLAYLSYRIGYDFSGLPLDEPLPADISGHGVSGILQQHGNEEAATLREIALAEAVKESFLVVGTADTAADQLESAMNEIGGDGFAFRETMTPSRIIPIADQLMPELRRRGLARTGFRYDTFRENLHDPGFAVAPEM